MLNFKEEISAQFRCYLTFSHFPVFKKNYPFYPFLILKIILFSKTISHIMLKLGQSLNFRKDRKRIKISKEWKNFVELVNSHYITVFRCKNCTQLDFSIKFFVGVETPTYKLIIFTLLCKICFWVPTNRT